MLSTIYKWIGLAVAAVLGILGIWAAGRKSGKDTATVEATQVKMEEVKQDAAAAVEAEHKATTIQVDTAKRANDVANKVSTADISDVDNQLRKKWTRD